MDIEKQPNNSLAWSTLSLLSIALTGILTACTRSDSGNSNPTPFVSSPPSVSIDGTNATNADADEPWRIMEALLAGDFSDEAAIRRAESILVSRCMDAAGFDYPSLPEYERTQMDDRSFFAWNYGPDDLGLVRIQGYTITDSDTSFSLRPPESSEEETALMGTKSSPGCVASTSVLYGDINREARYTEVSIQLQNWMVDARTKMESSEAFAALTREWSACMKGRGYEYRNFIDPAIQQWPAPRPSTVEIATATADVECKLIADAPRSVARLLGEIEAEQYEKEVELVGEFLKARDAVKRASAQLLAEGG